MKNKKVTKVVLSVLTSMSMLSSYSAMVFAGIQIKVQRHK